MIRFDHLRGVPFVHGQDDCYELCRRFYRDNFDLELTPYARPDDWWNKGLDLYGDYYRAEGFEPIHVHPRDIAIGDAFLMAIRSKVPNHAAIYVGEGQILHHFYGRLSNVEPYNGIWKLATVAHLRHPLVAAKVDEQQRQVMTKVDLMDHLPPYIKQLMREADEAIRGTSDQ